MGRRAQELVPGPDVVSQIQDIVWRIRHYLRPCSHLIPLLSFSACGLRADAFRPAVWKEAKS